MDIGLGTLAAFGSRYYPEAREVIGVVAIATLYYFYLLFDDERRRCAKVLFGIGETSVLEQEISKERIDLNLKAPWRDSNDALVEALQLSEGNPTKGMQRIRELVERGVNINARDESGRTILDLALYMECSPGILSLLRRLGANQSKV